MYTVLIKSNHISSINATYPSLFAKSSLLWPAVVAIFGDKEIRKIIKKNFFCSLTLCNGETSLRMRAETRRELSTNMKSRSITRTK